MRLCEECSADVRYCGHARFQRLNQPKFEVLVLGDGSPSWERCQWIGAVSRAEAEQYAHNLRKSGDCDARVVEVQS